MDIARITVEWSDGKRVELAPADLELCWRYVDHDRERLKGVLRLMAEHFQQPPSDIPAEDRTDR